MSKTRENEQEATTNESSWFGYLSPLAWYRYSKSAWDKVSLYQAVSITLRESEGNFQKEVNKLPFKENVRLLGEIVKRDRKEVLLAQGRIAEYLIPKIAQQQKNSRDEETKAKIYELLPKFVEKRCIEVLRSFSKYNFKFLPEDRHKALLEAIEGKDVDLVGFFIEEVYIISSLKEDEKNDLLDKAAMDWDAKSDGEDFNVLKVLLCSNKFEGKRDYLQYAVEFGNPKLLELFLKHHCKSQNKIDLLRDIKGEDGSEEKQSLLMMAILNGGKLGLDLAKVLLENKANPDSCGSPAALKQVC